MKISRATLVLLSPELAAQGEALDEFRLCRVHSKIWFVETKSRPLGLINHEHVQRPWFYLGLLYLTPSARPLQSRRDL